MDGGHTVTCLLCNRSEETETTGALSSKKDVTAHQNCLLYSSGIFCENSPQEDELFGFSVDDVMQEVRRGKKLKCHSCKKPGATSGCELKLCKKSYHYPCAVEDKAQPFEETNAGKYGIYCSKHLGLQSDGGSVNGCTSSVKKRAAPVNPSEAGASKGQCLTCENKEGKVAWDSLSRSYCDKHAPSSHKDSTGASSGVGPSAQNDDKSSSSAASKNPLSSDEDEDVRPVRKRSKRRALSDPFYSNEVITNTGSLLFAPVEDDDCSEYAMNESPPDPTPVRNDSDSPTGSGSNQGSGNQPEDESRDRDDEDDDDAVMSSDLSQSLLAPAVFITSPTSACTFPEGSPLTEPALEKAEERKEKESSPDGQTTAPSVPFHASKPGSVSSPAFPAPPEPFPVAPVSLVSYTSSSSVPSPEPEPGIDSASFWKNCNAAGCTGAVFSDFLKEMNELSERIQSERASQTDYDRALKVMVSSGQLEKLVKKQQKELRRKQRELERAAAAMSKVVSALQR